MQSSHPRWSPIQSTTSWRGVDAHHCNLLIPGGHQSNEQHLGGGWTLIIANFSSQVVTNPNNNILEGGGRSSLQSSQPGEEVPLRGGLGLSMEGLEGGGGAEETRKGGTEAFGQFDSKVKVFSLSCTRIFCTFLFCDQCLERACLSRKYSPWNYKPNSEIKPLIAVQRKRR